MTTRARRKPQPAIEPAAPPPEPTPAPPEMQSTRGIECRRCGCRHFLTVWTKPIADGSVRRRRECRHCGHEMTTKETPIGG